MTRVEDEVTAIPVPARRGFTFPWALALPLILLWALTALIYLDGLRHQHGHFIYCLDDAYIHMAMAKHFAQEGVWGVTRDGFTSSASSLLWPLCIAGVFRIIGPHVFVQFWLNLLISSGIVIIAYRLLRRQGLSAPFTAVALALLIVAMPLPTMIFTGMEHCLQALVVMLFIYVAGEVLAVDSFSLSFSLSNKVNHPQDSTRGSARQPSLKKIEKDNENEKGKEITGEGEPGGVVWYLYLLAPLLTLVRFEGMLLAAVACVLLLLRRKPWSAVIVGVGALLPVAVYAWISIAHGWLWMPNSVLLKGNTPHLASLHGLASLAVTFAKRIFTVPGVRQVLLLTLGTYLANGARTRRWWSGDQCRVLLFLCLLFLHGLTAGNPVFFRYEAYLVAVGVFVVAVPLGKLVIAWWPRATSRADLYRGAAVLIALLAMIDLANSRGVYGLLLTPQASTNIYRQQIQMARFIARYYPGTVIAANDIGAINYFADIHCVDLAGLASMPAARRMKQHTLSQAAMAEVCRDANVKIAIFYLRWFPTPPTNWICVSKWVMDNNVVCGDAVVYFYAVDPTEAAPLAAHIKEFRTQLPDGEAVYMFRLPHAK